MNPESMLRGLAALVAALAPHVASAQFRCDQSVQVNAAWCQESLIPSVKQGDASAVCSAFTRKLQATCRPDWDRFTSCDEFARRFADLLVQVCRSKHVPEKACADWGNSFAVGPLTRCERKHVKY